MKRQADIEILPKKTNRRLFQEYSEALVVAIILAIIIRAFLIQAFKIPSGSMIPTLLVGDHILVNKFIYGWRIPFTSIRWPQIADPKSTDVIVFVYPNDRSKDFIKRVVAVEGDTIEIRDKKVLVNGKEITEPYAHHYLENQTADPRRDNLESQRIPKGKLFVMGDNRDGSHDSRFWGFVPVDDVKGKAFMIYYSADHFPNIRWERVFSIIR